MDTGMALGFIGEGYVLSSAANGMTREWMYPRQI
jgi:hypothetical protein